MYRELGIEVEIEYFEGGFTLKYKTCPFYKLVTSGQKTWLCNLRRKTIEHIASRVSRKKRKNKNHQILASKRTSMRIRDISSWFFGK